MITEANVMGFQSRCGLRMHYASWHIVDDFCIYRLQTFYWCHVFIVFNVSNK